MPGKYDEDLAVITPSTEELRKFVSQHAETPDAFSYEVFLCRPGTDCAARGLEDRVSRNASDADTLDEAAKLYMKRGNYTRVVELWRRRAQIDPANASWRSDVGDGLLFLRDFAGARREYAAAQELDPRGTYYQALTAWSYFFEGNFEQTAKILESHLATDTSPSADEILLTYFVLQRLGRQKEGQAMLTEQTASFRSSDRDDHLLLLAFDGRLDPWWPPSDGLAGRKGRFFQAQKTLLLGDIKWTTDQLNEVVKAGRNDELWTLAARIELERLPKQAEKGPAPTIR